MASTTAAGQSTPSQAYLDQNNVGSILGITGAFAGVALLTVCVRLYVRISMLKSMGADDYAITAAMVMALATFACFVGESHYGLGRHYQVIGLTELEGEYKWTFFHSIVVMFGTVFVKISIAFFLMRIVPQRWWRVFLWSAIVFLTCFALSCAGTIIFSCVPVAASWDVALRENPKTKCFSSDTFADIGLFNSIINIFTDVLFAVLPLPIIYKLQINRRTKISLIFVLSLGYVACAAGIAKAHAQIRITHNEDYLYDDTFMVWAMLELCLGILAASFPALKPLFSSMLETTRSRLNLSGSRSRTQPLNGYPALSQNSGYQRQQNSRDFHKMAHDVVLEDYKTGASTQVRSLNSSGLQSDHDTIGSDMRPYNVRVTSGYPHNRGDGPDLSRSESEERLHQPMAILRTTEVLHHSQALES